MRCAVCQQPVARPVRQGDHAFHPRCLQVFNTYRLAIEDAKQAIERKERLLQQEHASAADARVKLMHAERETQSLATRLSAAEAERHNLRTQLEAERQRNRKDREDAAIAIRRQAELLAENDQLRAEINLQRTLDTGRPPAAQGSPSAPAAEDGRDPTEVRASLLELD